MFSEIYRIFILSNIEFTGNFRHLNAVLKEFEMKYHIDIPFLNIIMMNRDRKTLPFYKTR